MPTPPIVGLSTRVVDKTGKVTYLPPSTTYAQYQAVTGRPFSGKGSGAPSLTVKDVLAEKAQKAAIEKSLAEARASPNYYLNKGMGVAGVAGATASQVHKTAVAAIGAAGGKLMPIAGSGSTIQTASQSQPLGNPLAIGAVVSGARALGPTIAKAATSGVGKAVIGGLVAGAAGGLIAKLLPDGSVQLTRRRSRNFGNVKALRRSLSRVAGFNRLVKSVDKAFRRAAPSSMKRRGGSPGVITAREARGALSR